MQVTTYDRRNTTYELRYLVTMKKRVEVYYSGRVQGVGFRFTTEDIAARFKVAGFVRNIYDGRVQVLAEGEEEVLANFLEKIEEVMRHYIRDRELRWDECRNEFNGFGIRF